MCLLLYIAICVYCYKHIFGVCFFLAAKLTNTLSKIDQLKIGTILFRVREISTRRGKGDNYETELVKGSFGDILGGEN